MNNVTSLAEFQYRRQKQEDERCKRVAMAMLEREESEAKKMIFECALEGWLDAGNGRNGDDAA